MPATHTGLRWLWLAGVVMASAANAQTPIDDRNAVEQRPAAPSSSATAQAPKPDALLAIDRNRETVITRIVNEWGDQLAAETGVHPAQLREMLSAMRADQLLAASLAGSLRGLHAVVEQALPAGAPAATSGTVPAKALGNATQDLVYTPVTPCRLFDTRASQGGLGTPVLGTPRTYGAIAPVANQGGPGGCAAAATATVALVLIGTLTPAGNGLLQAGPQGGAPFPNALILYQPGDQYGTTVALPMNPANGRFDLVEQFARSDLYGDLLGYFSPPAATALDCVNVQLNGVGNANVLDNKVVNFPAAAACPAGYTATSLMCQYAGLAPAGLALTQVGAPPPSFFDACVWRNQTGTTLDRSDFSTATRCCRVPGH